MTWLVGLTDHPGRRCAGHGYPRDWKLTAPFESEADALEWQAAELAQRDCRAGPNGDGWRFGYKYRITSVTRQ